MTSCSCVFILDQQANVLNSNRCYAKYISFVRKTYSLLTWEQSMNQYFSGFTSFDNMWNSLWYHTASNILNIELEMLNQNYRKTKKNYLIQSMIGQTDKHKVHPVQSLLTCARCVFESNSIA